MHDEDDDANDFTKKAKTDFSILSMVGKEMSWLELRPITGRKHQLRIHCASVLNAPIVGDEKGHVAGFHGVNVNVAEGNWMERMEPTNEKVRRILMGNTIGMAKGLRKREQRVEEDAGMVHLYARCVEFKVPIDGEGEEYKKNCRVYTRWYRKNKEMHEWSELYERIPTRMEKTGERGGRSRKKMDKELEEALRCKTREERRAKLRRWRVKNEKRMKRAKVEKYELRLRVYAPPPEHFERSLRAVGLGPRLAEMMRHR